MQQVLGIDYAKSNADFSRISFWLKEQARNHRIGKERTKNIKTVIPQQKQIRSGKYPKYVCIGYVEV